MFEQKRYIKETEKVMVSDFRLFFGTSFVVSLLLYLCFVGVLFWQIHIRIIRPIVELTYQINQLKSSQSRSTRFRNNNSSSGVVVSSLDMQRRFTNNKSTSTSLQFQQTFRKSTVGSSVSNDVDYS